MSDFTSAGVNVTADASGVPLPVFKPARQVTFAGDLGPDDWAVQFDQQLATVDRKPRDPLRYVPGLAKQLSEAGLAKQLSEAGLAKQLSEAGLAATLTAAAAGRALNVVPAYRSPRPYECVSVSWMAENAGQGFEDVAVAVGKRSDFMPGVPLEVWSLPVVDFMLHFLLIPAGDWPPATAGG